MCPLVGTVWTGDDVALETALWAKIHMMNDAKFECRIANNVIEIGRGAFSSPDRWERFSLRLYSVHPTNSSFKRIIAFITGIMIGRAWTKLTDANFVTMPLLQPVTLKNCEAHAAQSSCYRLCFLQCPLIFNQYHNFRNSISIDRNCLKIIVLETLFWYTLIKTKSLIKPSSVLDPSVVWRAKLG